MISLEPIAEPLSGGHGAAETDHRLHIHGVVAPYQAIQDHRVKYASTSKRPESLLQVLQKLGIQSHMSEGS